MKSQDQIISETEMQAEKCRQELALSKAKISDSNIHKCYVNLENLLFEFSVLFYTHRTIWTHHIFWINYANSDNPMLFAKGAYNQMILGTLSNCYSKLYFCIEGALFTYLAISKRKTKPSIVDTYSLLNKELIPNYDETGKGLEILRCVRNSYHGNNGSFNFSYDDVEITYKDETYSFQKDKPTSVSYKFIRDFLPSVIELYNALFLSIYKNR